ncbi:protein Abitram [Rhynchophorus ferrugineus]|uniref:protein Abitram n=1 Tax=Rhynchophorus ferrugineus TaxID=354439 RepID=UPI003FCC5F63
MDSHECEIDKYIKDLSIPILESIEKTEIEKFQPYYLRYYEDKYCVEFNRDGVNNDVLLRFHTNRIVLISLAKGHDVIRQEKIIEGINFEVKGVNRTEICLSGKKKHGAKKLRQDSVLCYIKCKDDDREYPVYTSVPASFIEVNSHILKDPHLLVSDYKKLGYIGVLYPQCYGPKSMSVDVMAEKYKLLSEKEYEDYLLSNIPNKIIN